MTFVKRFATCAAYNSSVCSGGQKARITLARAVYSNAKILLMDDILAALDVHTARWIVDYCLHGDLMENRTVLLTVSNHVYENTALRQSFYRHITLH